MSGFLEMKKRALLMGANIFWLPTGVARDDVIAAYRFKGVASEDVAQEDLTLHRNKLLKGPQEYPDGTSHTPTWASAEGYKFEKVRNGNSGYLTCDGVNTADIKSAIVCYEGVNQNHCAILISAGGKSGIVQIFAATSAQVITAVNDATQEIVSEYQNFEAPGFASYRYRMWKEVGNMMYKKNTSYKASGVIGVNFEARKMFLDGTVVPDNEMDKVSTGGYEHAYTDFGVKNGEIQYQGFTFGNSHSPKVGLNGKDFSQKTIIAAAFYAVELTADQHAEVANAMLAL